MGGKLAHDSKVSSKSTVPERTIDYLDSVEDWKRPHEVAEATGASQNYQGKVLRDLHRDGEVEKRKKRDGALIYVLPGEETKPISDKEVAIEIIDRYPSGLTVGQARAMNLGELQTYIRENVAQAVFPADKVWYKRN